VRVCGGIIMIGLRRGGIRSRKSEVIKRIRVRRILIWRASKNVLIGRVRERCVSSKIRENIKMKRIAMRM